MSPSFVETNVSNILTQSPLLQATLLNIVSETTNDTIFVKDSASRLLYVNKAALAVIGKPACDVLGKSELEWHGDKAQAIIILANDRQIMATRQPERFEETFTGSNGTRTYLVNKSAWVDEAGTLQGMIGIGRDITEQKKNRTPVTTK